MVGVDRKALQQMGVMEGSHQMRTVNLYSTMELGSHTTESAFYKGQT